MPEAARAHRQDMETLKVLAAVDRGNRSTGEFLDRFELVLEQLQSGVRPSPYLIALERERIAQRWGEIRATNEAVSALRKQLEDALAGAR